MSWYFISGDHFKFLHPKLWFDHAQRNCAIPQGFEGAVAAFTITGMEYLEITFSFQYPKIMLITMIELWLVVVFDVHR